MKFLQRFKVPKWRVGDRDNPNPGDSHRGVKAFRLVTSQAEAFHSVYGSGLDTELLGSGHFSCPNCDQPFFNVERVDNHLRVGCYKCGYEQMLFVYAKWDEPYGLKRGMLGCDRCGANQFAVIKDKDILSVGCRRCPWDMQVHFKDRGGLILP